MKWTEDKYWSKLEDYAKGNLDTTEKEEMDSWVANNKEAQIAIKGFSILNETFKNKKELNQYHEKRTDVILKGVEASKNQILRPKLYYAVAASIALIIISSLFYYQTTKSDPIDSLVSEFLADTYQAPFTTRDESTDIETWIVAYRNNEYIEVISILGRSPDLTGIKHLYLGLSYLYLERYDDAVEQLEVIEASEKFIYEQAQWFLALTNLRLGDFNNAKGILTKIQNTQSYKSKEASMILKILS